MRVNFPIKQALNAMVNEDLINMVRQKSPLKESIGRTDCFVAGASSDISEEMIELSFLECFQIMILLLYSFVTTSSVFCFPFFSKVQSKIGVRIIHGRALYKGKYGNVFL